jgi:hypothetical protein
VTAEPLARLTLPLLNYVPKQNPLPFAPPAVDLFVPSVPLLPPKRGVGYTAKMERPELPSSGGSPAACAGHTRASGAEASPPKLGVGQTTRMERPDLASIGASPAVRPASQLAEQRSGATSPKSGLLPVALSAEAAFSLPAPELPTWASTGARVTPGTSATPAGVSAVVARAQMPGATHPPLSVAHPAPTFGAPPLDSADNLRLDSVRASMVTGGHHEAASASATVPAHPPGPDPQAQPGALTPRLPGTPANMTTPHRLSPRRRLFLAPLLGFAIAAAASSLFLLTGARARSAAAPSASAAAEPGTNSAVVPAPEAPPSAPSPPPASSATSPPPGETPAHPEPVPPPQDTAPPTPVASARAAQAPPVPRPPKATRPASVARPSPYRTPVIPLVGD